MSDTKLIILPRTLPKLAEAKGIEKMMEQGLETTQQTSLVEKEEVHRLEFIMYKAYTVCNVMINNVWHTCSFPATTSVGEFLIHGSIHSARNWPKGRKYDNED